MPGELLQQSFNVIEKVAAPHFCEVLSAPLQVLRNLFEELDVDPPEKIFLVAKEKKETTSVTSDSFDSKPSSISKTSASDDLNLTGSPLKCPFSLKEEDDSEIFSVDSEYSKRSLNVGPKYLPISLNQAKKCISRYNSQAIQKKITSRGCWVVCDPEDSYLFLGARRFHDSHSIYKVTWSGPHDCKSAHLKMSYFMENYHKPVAPTCSNVKQILTAKSEYNLSGISDDWVSERSDNSVVTINFTWTKPKELLERPPLLAEAEVRLEVFPGDEKMSTHSLFMELKALQGFTSGLSNLGITWRVAQPGKKPFREEVEVFLRLIGDAGGKPKVQSRKNEDEAGPGEEDPLSFEARSDLDFTDHLWNLLAGANSYSQMSNTINGILQFIQSQELRPFIYPKNETRIARMVQDIVRGREDPPVLDGKIPLEILVEIGIEKLMRDYVHALLTSRLASRDQLSPFLTNDHLLNCNLSVSNLFKLHLVHEIVCLCKMYLSIDQDCLRSVVQLALKQLQNYDIHSQNSHIFIFPISSGFVTEKVSKTSPSNWQCTAVAKNPHLEVITTVNLSLEPLSDLISVKIEACNDTLEKIDISYYATYASTIKRNEF